MKTKWRGDGGARVVGGILAVGVAVLLVPAPVSGQAASDQQPVTYAGDVATILQENCQVCHRPGAMGPMSLLTYEEARPWAPLIKQAVVERRMPPWHVDKTIGIREYANDISLSNEEIGAIVAWVDGGTPLGNPADLPPAVEWPDLEGSWVLQQELGRPPDLVYRSPGFTVEPTGMDQWFEPEIVLEGLDETRYIMATESRPSLHSRAVTHHGNSSLAKFGGPGTPYDLYPAGTGLRVTPGETVWFNLHYFPLGERVEDAYVEVGLWFYDEEPPYVLRSSTRVFGSYNDFEGGEFSHMLIPPHTTQVLKGYHVLQEPSWLFSARGHMHNRGMGQSIEAIYPDGRQEVLIKYGFDHAWHLTYIWDDDVQPLLPAGTVLVVTSFVDNTAANPSNPDPDQWVVQGRRTGDEMSHIHVQIVSLTPEDFEQKVREREERLEEIADAGRE